jgi:hypothetical protein
MTEQTDAPCETHGVNRCTICDPHRQQLLAEVIAKAQDQCGPFVEINPVDIADVHLSIIAAYKAAQTVRVLNGATHVERVGQVALTRGRRPAFLLVEPKWKGGAGHLLGHNDVVVARRDPKAGWVSVAKVEDHNGSEVL